MSLTPNFGMNIPDATDIVNLLTQCYPNFTLLDGALQSIKETGVTTASETKSGTVHQLVRTDVDCDVLRFTATSNFTTGDSFTVDGTPVTGVAVNGASLQTGDFVINSNVIAIVNGGVLTLFAGGNAAPAASDVTYDNSGSGLSATDVQDAIDEVLGDIPANAAALSYDNSGSGLSATNVQDAIDEVLANIPSDSGSVSVTADGVKTYSQLFDALYALIDETKLSYKSAIYKVMAGTGHKSQYSFAVRNSVGFYFTMTYMDSACTIEGIEVKASGSKNQYCSGNFTIVNASNGVPAAGTTITLYY